MLDWRSKCCATAIDHHRNPTSSPPVRVLALTPRRETVTTIIIIIMYGERERGNIVKLKEREHRLNNIPQTKGKENNRAEKSIQFSNASSSRGRNIFSPFVAQLSYHYSAAPVGIPEYHLKKNHCYLRCRECGANAKHVLAYL